MSHWQSIGGDSKWTSNFQTEVFISLIQCLNIVTCSFNIVFLVSSGTVQLLKLFQEKKHYFRILNFLIAFQPPSEKLLRKKMRKLNKQRLQLQLN